MCVCVCCTPSQGDEQKLGAEVTKLHKLERDLSHQVATLATRESGLNSQVGGTAPFRSTPHIVTVHTTSHFMPASHTHRLSTIGGVISHQ